jgi:hypothetical protein
MKVRRILAALLLAAAGVLFARDSSQNSTAPKTADNYSGMYSFLRDGEFVQVTVEEAGVVTGFVSRFGDSESDRGAFLDQFFKQGKLAGTQIGFTTETVHGVWFEFKGTADRGEGKDASEEAYHILKGTLTEFRTDADKKVTAKSREVVFKSFPQDTDSPPPAKKPS